MVATFEPKTDYKVVGTRPIRHDGYDKVTGRAVYGADMKLPGLIWAVCVRSPHAHAKIKSIDTSAAEPLALAKRPSALTLVPFRKYAVTAVSSLSSRLRGRNGRPLRADRSRQRRL